VKRYPVTFVDDYIQYEKWANDINQDDFTRNHFMQEINDDPENLELCKKWVGKEIILQEVEKNMEEFKEILFNGKRIMIVNGHLE